MGRIAAIKMIYLRTICGLLNTDHVRDKDLDEIFDKNHVT